MKARLPENEDLRLEALRRYRILDSGPESQFDDVAALAANICGAPHRYGQPGRWPTGNGSRPKQA